MKYYDNKLSSDVHPSHLGWTNQKGVTSSLESLKRWLDKEYSEQDVSISSGVKAAYNSRSEKKLWALKTLDGEQVEVVVNEEYKSRRP